MADFKIHILRPNGIWLSTFCGREEDTWSDQFAENYILRGWIVWKNVHVRNVLMLWMLTGKENSVNFNE